MDLGDLAFEPQELFELSQTARENHVSGIPEQDYWDAFTMAVNYLLEKRLQRAPKVFSWEQKYWHPQEHLKDEQTHSARLVCIEEIK